VTNRFKGVTVPTGRAEFRPQEFWLGVVTLLGVSTLDVLPGLVMGVVTSIVLLLYTRAVSIATRTNAGRSKWLPGPMASGHVKPRLPSSVVKYVDHPCATTLAPAPGA
jgi:MFS superfamily sulfate permease-like transporter